METSGINENDIIEVKLLDIDARTGKFKLSRKALLPRLPKKKKKVKIAASPSPQRRGV